MGFKTNLFRTIKQRPFLIAKYSRETILFIYSYLMLKTLKAKNVSIGENPHVISPWCFQAELPGAGISAGDHIIVWDKTKIYAWGEGKIMIGNCCSFGSDTIVHCRERVEIGNYALISWGVLIADFDAHSTDYNERIAEIEYAKTVLWPNFSRKKEPAPRAYAPKFYTRPIIIEDGAWIGANATILKGAKIGRGSIIGANAVVTGEIPPMSVAVGNPARVVRTVQ